MKFRGHHLVCLHFFEGKGYSEEFVRNLKDLMGRARKGEEIEVVQGADDVCRSCPHLVENQCMHEDGTDAEIRKLDNIAIDYLGVAVGKRVLWREIENKVSSASKEWFSVFCTGCYWEKVCADRRNPGKGANNKCT